MNRYLKKEKPTVVPVKQLGKALRKKLKSVFSDVMMATLSVQTVNLTEWHP